MLAGPRIKVLGYRWLSSGGHDACPRCAALHGKEFLFKPSGGQLSVEEMPEPPLHPNCRCTALEIIGFDGTGVAPEENDNSPEANSISKDEYVGLRWRRNTPFNGPIYEKYGGLHWSEGRDTTDPEAQPCADKTPADSMDAIFAEHDNCYDLISQHPCDLVLIEELLSLPNDPRDWDRPPAVGKHDEAKTYRKWAIRVFKWKVYWHDVERNLRELDRHTYPVP